MAVAAYYTWARLGRPLEPAVPIREMVERLRVRFPDAAAANLFSWFANEAHYTAVPAQDHTPFSQTGWPDPSPQWVVFATDIMHRVDLGVDCWQLFAYYLAEAKAGRMPWLKYMIWQAKIYDVRNGWRAQNNSGHFDHIHLSARTDHRFTHLGSWPVAPLDEDEDMDVYYRIQSNDEDWNGRTYVSNRVHSRRLRNPKNIQGPAVDEAKLVTLTDAMRLSVSATETWDSYVNAVAGPPAPVAAEVEIPDSQLEALADMVAERLRELRFVAE